MLLSYRNLRKASLLPLSFPMNSQNPFPKRQHDQKWTFYEITTSIMSAEYQYVIENAAKSITNWSCHAPAFLEQFNWSCKRKFSVCLYQTHQTWQLLDQLDWSSKLKTYACLINLISKNRSSNGLAVIPRFCTIPTIFFFNFKFFLDWGERRSHVINLFQNIFLTPRIILIRRFTVVE